MTVSYRLFATAAKGLESLLLHELVALGATDAKATRAGVAFRGDLALAYRACLWSRLASRILLQLAEYPAADPEAVYRGAHAIDWTQHFSADQTFAVEFTAAPGTGLHTHYGALKIKDAVVDFFRERDGVRPSVDTERPQIRINGHVQRGIASLSLDLSGDSLHRRGYRVGTVAAPLKENLAAAILLRAEWPRIAREGGALVDPMCGSGTLPIEAALMAGDIAPGLLREHFGFLSWRQHDAVLWQRLLDEARTRREAGINNVPPIRGYDIDAGAIRAALENLERADLRRLVHIEKRGLQECGPAIKADTGLVVANPPYGERLGKDSDLPALYAQLGAHFKNCFAGWRAAVFTANPTLGKDLGLHAQRIHKLFNGPLACDLLHFTLTPEHFYTRNRGERAVQRALAAPVSAGSEMFGNRLRKNLKTLGRWAARAGIDCYRVYDADMPEYALAIDLYRGDKLWVHVQEYEAPATIDADKAKQRLQDALAAMPSVLDVPPEQIFLKVRRKQKGHSQYEKQGSGGKFFEVREGHARLWVNFTDYLDTGLFLDHRLTRTLIGELAHDRDFLNLFGYTGTATVHAALGGARSTTTVDMSRTYLDWAARNMMLNQLTGPQHRFVQADVTAWLQDAARGPRYGLIFLDPPTFSTSKRMEGTFDVQRDHVELIRNTAELLAPGGALVFSNNHRRFKLDAVALADFEIVDITRETIPEDFARNARIHQCWKISR